MLDPDDEDPALAPPASGFDPSRAARDLGENLPEQRLRALYVAACRELFEEAGLLLARHRSGAPLGTKALERIQASRGEVHANRQRLVDVLQREAAVLALDELRPLARWITPEQQPKRWDARFFLAPAPSAQEPSPDDSETEEPRWFRPAEALEAYRAGGIVLAPPTYRVLEDLSRFRTTSEALQAAEREGPPRPVLPVPLLGAERPTLVYPGDREHPADPGPGFNRLILENGRWRSVRSSG